VAISLTGSAEEFGAGAEHAWDEEPGAARSGVKPRARAACSVCDSCSPCGWYRHARHGIQAETICISVDNASTRRAAQALLPKLIINGWTGDQSLGASWHVLDGALDREDFEQRKTALHMERLNLEEQLQIVNKGQSLSMAELDRYIALVKNAQTLTNLLSVEELREWMQEAMSHRSATGKNVVFTLQNPLAEVSMRLTVPIGSPREDTSRTFWKGWINRLQKSSTDFNNRIIGLP